MIDYSSYTGAFQICTAKDRTWIHADSFNGWAAVCYLTPDAPLSSGTALYRWKETKEDMRTDNTAPYYDGYDYTKWEMTDYIANKYNRIVLYRGNLYHASLDYFGDNLQNGRLFQTFFFNTEF
jgi:predicted NodU family carbamoyl transferase